MGYFLKSQNGSACLLLSQQIELVNTIWYLKDFKLLHMVADRCI
jgi:hypothetical protein